MVGPWENRFRADTSRKRLRRRSLRTELTNRAVPRPLIGALMSRLCNEIIIPFASGLALR